MKKQFKTESKRLMDLMINSIYTNKEIFLREIISNASDAIDKLHYKSLMDKSIKVNKKDFEIFITIDNDNKTLSISDNGIGMNKEELEKNLGTIAKSGSYDFKNDNDKKKNIDIIGQFGVGFYSSFMVAKKVTVITKKYGDEIAYKWTSKGIDGYVIEECNKDSYGTTVVLEINDDKNDEKYSKYLDQYEIIKLIKKYSDYITYPIKMNVEERDFSGDEKTKDKIIKKVKTLNTLTPIWKRDKNKIKDEEYDTFYFDKFNDYDKPISKIHTKAEGLVSFNSLLYIPSHAPFDFYTKDYQKGLQLYSNGVLIIEKCSDLLPDYFGFIKGVVDSPDVSLNISREMLQQDKNLKFIAKALEKKIKNELKNMLENNREDYEKFFKAFGSSIKFGIYNNYGMDKDKLLDLVMFNSSNDKKLYTLGEYVSRMKENQKDIYYACGESLDKIDLLPQVESVKDKGYEVLYLTDYIDEFVLKIINKYDDKLFKNVSTDDIDLTSDLEKEQLKKDNEESKDMFQIMKEALVDVKDVRFTNKLSKHPVCLSTEGEVSIEMEKVINAMPTDENIKANKILEINKDHEIVNKLKDLYKRDKESLKEYAKVLYSEARLIEGLPIENPTEISNLICKFLSK